MNMREALLPPAFLSLIHSERKEPIMKSIRMLLALTLAFVMALTLLAGCSNTVSNNFTSADVKDSGTASQRWLRFPGSDLVVNPAAVGNENYEDDSSDLGLTIGLQDEKGNTVQTIEDAIFHLESVSANGFNAEPVIPFDFGDPGLKGVSKCATYSTSGTGCVCSTGNSGVRLFSAGNEVLIDYSAHYYLLLKIASVSGSGIEAMIYLNNPASEPTLATYTEPGTYMYDVTEYLQSLSNYDPEKKQTITPRLYLEANGEFAITDYMLCTMQSGYQGSAEALKNEFGLYYKKTSVAYPCGTALEVSDSIIGSSVSRTITCTACGAYATCGRIHGTASYDEKHNVINVDCGSYRYQINPKRKSPIVYYDTYEDLLSQQNGKDSPSSSSQYWCMVLSNVNQGDSYSVACSASATKTFDELTESGEIAVANTKIKKYLAECPDYWDAYIAANDVSDYIQNIPQ